MDTTTEPRHSFHFPPPVFDSPSPVRGAVARRRVRITVEPIRIEELLAAVASPACGGTVLFIGTVRDDADTRRDGGLIYEAYAGMARKHLERLAERVARRVPGARVAAMHRAGRVAVGEAAVAIAVSAPHREEAFAACREAVETLKREIPIWKI